MLANFAYLTHYENKRTLGSVMSNQVSHRDAWAIIGKKGASPASVPESYVCSISHAQSSALLLWRLVETLKLSNMNPVRMRSTQLTACSTSEYSYTEKIMHSRLDSYVLTVEPLILDPPRSG